MGAWFIFLSCTRVDKNIYHVGDWWCLESISPVPSTSWTFREWIPVGKADAVSLDYFASDSGIKTDLVKVLLICLPHAIRYVSEHKHWTQTASPQFALWLTFAMWNLNSHCGSGSLPQSGGHVVHLAFIIWWTGFWTRMTRWHCQQTQFFLLGGLFVSFRNEKYIYCFECVCLHVFYQAR